MEKLNITQGAWRYKSLTDRDDIHIQIEAGENGFNDVGEYLSISGIGKLEDAVLIVEAATVHNETGLTPRQLLEQRNELLEALKGMISIFPFAVSPEGKEIIEMTNTAIQNTQR